MTSDVAESGSAEQRVDDRVSENVGIAVAGEPRFALELLTTEDEPTILGETVDIEADPDSHDPAHLRPVVSTRGLIKRDSAAEQDGASEVDACWNPAQSERGAMGEWDRTR